MSTKRLRRTLVEGGKRRGATENHRLEVKAARRRARIHYSVNNYDEDRPDPEGIFREWGREFADKLRPLYRYLKSRVGDRWNDVYSDICRGNDPRSIKGWHLRDHVHGYVTRYRSPQYFHYGLHVDEDGILQESVPNKYRSTLTKQERDLYKLVWSWMGELLVLPVGNEIMWFTPVRNAWGYCHGAWDCHRPHKANTPGALPRYLCLYASSYRQLMPFARAQRAYWDRLPVAVRDRIHRESAKIMRSCIDSSRRPVDQRQVTKAWLDAIIDKKL